MSLYYEVPLVTKSWNINYGTLLSLPLNSFIKRVIKDSDGEFTIFCTKIDNGEVPYWRIDVSNPSFEFDYTISILKNYVSEVQLNKPLIQNFTTGLGSSKGLYYNFYDATEKIRISINLFLYNKLDISVREQTRNHVHALYKYQPIDETEIEEEFPMCKALLPIIIHQEKPATGEVIDVTCKVASTTTLKSKSLENKQSSKITIQNAETNEIITIDRSILENLEYSKLSCDLCVRKEVKAWKTKEGKILCSFCVFAQYGLSQQDKSHQKSIKNKTTATVSKNSSKRASLVESNDLSHDSKKSRTFEILPLLQCTKCKAEWSSAKSGRLCNSCNSDNTVNKSDINKIGQMPFYANFEPIQAVQTHETNLEVVAVHEDDDDKGITENQSFEFIEDDRLSPEFVL